MGCTSSNSNCRTENEDVDESAFDGASNLTRSGDDVLVDAEVIASTRLLGPDAIVHVLLRLVQMQNKKQNLLDDHNELHRQHQDEHSDAVHSSEYSILSNRSRSSPDHRRPTEEDDDTLTHSTIMREITGTAEKQQQPQQQPIRVNFLDSLRRSAVRFSSATKTISSTRVPKRSRSATRMNKRSTTPYGTTHDNLSPSPSTSDTCINNNNNDTGTSPALTPTIRTENVTVDSVALAEALQVLQRRSAGLTENINDSNSGHICVRGSGPICVGSNGPCIGSNRHINGGNVRNGFIGDGPTAQQLDNRLREMHARKRNEYIKTSAGDGNVVDGGVKPKKSQWWSDLYREQEDVVLKWTVDDIRELVWSADDLNGVHEPETFRMPLDQSRPINEYFISTSHNTYLTGGQFSVTGGKVSVSACLQAIDLGSRCVELDCYDGAHGEPIITHLNGRIAGGSVTFDEAVKAIAARAFVKHQTPFILNLENHVGRTQSVRMANIINTYFGNRILTSDDPVFGHAALLYRQCGLPTLEQLNGRVLVRTKVREGTTTDANSKSGGTSHDDQSTKYASANASQVGEIAEAGNTMHRSRSSSALLAMSRSFNARRKYSLSTLNKDAVHAQERNGVVLVGSTKPALGETSQGTKTTTTTTIANEKQAKRKKSRTKMNEKRANDTTNDDVVVVGGAGGELNFDDELGDITDTGTLCSTEGDDVGEYDDDDENPDMLVVSKTSSKVTTDTVVSTRKDGHIHIDVNNNDSARDVNEPKSSTKQNGKSRNKEKSSAVEAGVKSDTTITPQVLCRLVYLRNVSWKNRTHGSTQVRCDVGFELMPWHTTSVSEIKIKRMCFGPGPVNVSSSFGSIVPNDKVMLATTHASMFRIFPKGTAVASQNYEPAEMWARGAQLVALNYQTSGPAMDVNNAMFKQHRGCGYVLKPAHMRRVPDQGHHITHDTNCHINENVNRDMRDGEPSVTAIQVEPNNNKNRKDGTEAVVTRNGRLKTSEGIGSTVLDDGNAIVDGVKVSLISDEQQQQKQKQERIEENEFVRVQVEGNLNVNDREKEDEVVLVESSKGRTRAVTNAISRSVQRVSDFRKGVNSAGSRPYNMSTALTTPIWSPRKRRGSHMGVVFHDNNGNSSNASNGVMGGAEQNGLMGLRRRRSCSSDPVSHGSWSALLDGEWEDDESERGSRDEAFATMMDEEAVVLISHADAPHLTTSHHMLLGQNHKALSSIVGDRKAPTQHAVFVRITVTGAQRTIIFTRRSPTLSRLKTTDNPTSDGMIENDVNNINDPDTNNNNIKNSNNNYNYNNNNNYNKNNTTNNTTNNKRNSNNNITSNSSSAHMKIKNGKQKKSKHAWKYAVDDLVTFPVKDRTLTMVTFELMEVINNASHHRVLAARTCLLLDLVQQWHDHDDQCNDNSNNNNNINNNSVGLRQVLLFVPGRQKVVCALHLQVTLEQPQRLMRTRSMNESPLRHHWPFAFGRSTALCSESSAATHTANTQPPTTPALSLETSTESASALVLEPMPEFTQGATIASTSLASIATATTTRTTTPTTPTKPPPTTIPTTIATIPATADTCAVSTLARPSASLLSTSTPKSVTNADTVSTLATSPSSASALVKRLPHAHTTPADTSVDTMIYSLETVRALSIPPTLLGAVCGDNTHTRSASRPHAWSPVTHLKAGTSGMVELVVISGEPCLNTRQGRDLDRHASKHKNRTYMQDWSNVKKQMPTVVKTRFKSPIGADANTAGGSGIGSNVAASSVAAAAAVASPATDGSGGVAAGSKIPKLDPYVVFKVFGHPGDERKLKTLRVSECVTSTDILKRAPVSTSAATPTTTTTTTTATNHVSPPFPAPPSPTLPTYDNDTHTPAIDSAHTASTHADGPPPVEAGLTHNVVQDVHAANATHTAHATRDMHAAGGIPNLKSIESEVLRAVSSGIGHNSTSSSHSKTSSNAGKKAGWRPTWATPFLFPVVMPELCFVHVTVRTKDIRRGGLPLGTRKTICSGTIWVQGLRPGYRCLAMRDANGHVIFNLLCHITLRGRPQHAIQHT